MRIVLVGASSLNGVGGAAGGRIIFLMNGLWDYLLKLIGLFKNA